MKEENYNPEDLGPIRYSNLCNANLKLRQGSATKDHAEAYVHMWNTPGKRLTKLKLVMRDLPANPYSSSLLPTPQLEQST